MARKKLLITTNAPWLHSGLAENGKFLAQHLQKTGKYDLVYLCQQVHANDGNHSRQPWKSYGAIPNDPAVHQRMQQDPGYAQAVSYGAARIGEIVNTEHPDIVWCSDDVWSFGADFFKSPWWSKINPILHITVDSLPVLDMAYEQARLTPSFFTWAEFASKEMRKQGAEYAHVKQIYGATNVSNFAPLSPQERKDLRKRFGLGEKTVIIGYTFRNQLRKEALSLLTAFRDFKKENLAADVKLHLHTSWSENQQGWDFPRLSKYLGVKTEDVLCTYVCKSCGQWVIAPYQGENLNCPICKAEKTMTTPTLQNGVAGEEMKYVYGIRDATVSPLTSGGLEYENVNTLLCGLPLATTNYSSGQDFCLQPFVYPINWHPRYEAHTSFVKATNDVKSIKNFIEKAYRMSDRDKQEIGAKGRAWAEATFSVEAVGKQWEAVFDALPPKDWSSITLESKPKNPHFQNPDISSNEEWVKALYNGALLVEPDPEGFKHWLSQLANGIPRSAIYDFFVGRAREDNAKSAPPQDFGTLLDMSSKRKRAIMLIKESIGDCVLISQLFESFHQHHPETDLYVATDPKHFEVFDGNPFVKKVLAYLPAMENEMAMIGAGQSTRYFDYYFHPAVQSQRHLNYLAHSNHLDIVSDTK